MGKSVEALDSKGPDVCISHMALAKTVRERIVLSL